MVEHLYSELQVEGNVGILASSMSLVDQHSLPREMARRHGGRRAPAAWSAALPE